MVGAGRVRGRASGGGRGLEGEGVGGGMVGGVGHFGLASASTCRHYIRKRKLRGVMAGGVCVYLSGGRGGARPVAVWFGWGCEYVFSRAPMLLQLAGPNCLEFPDGGVTRLWMRGWTYRWS